MYLLSSDAAMENPTESAEGTLMYLTSRCGSNSRRVQDMRLACSPPMMKRRFRLMLSGLNSSITATSPDADVPLPEA